MKGPWFEDRAFWEAVRPVLFSEDRVRQAKEEAGAIVDLLGLRPPARVLDLACGVGRHSLELARRGFQVTAVDLVEAYVEEGRRRAEEEGLAIEWGVADMRAFRREESFDGAFLFFTSFGFFETREEDRRVLDNLWASLVPGGRLLLEMKGKEVFSRTYPAVSTWYEGNGTLLLEDVAIENGFEGTQTRWIVVTPEGQRKEFTFRLRLYSARELRDMLEDVGFEDIAVYGGLHRELYDHTAKRMVVIARKPE